MLGRSVIPVYHSLAQVEISPLVHRLQACRAPFIRHFIADRPVQQLRAHSQRVLVSMSASQTPVRDSIQEKVQTSLKPVSLDIVDESSKHAGHAAMKGLPAGETHFRLSIVSPDFEGLTTIKRHKLVYKALAEELAGPVHALSLKTKAPSEAQ